MGANSLVEVEKGDKNESGSFFTREFILLVLIPCHCFIKIGH